MAGCAVRWDARAPRVAHTLLNRHRKRHRRIHDTRRRKSSSRVTQLIEARKPQLDAFKRRNKYKDWASGKQRVALAERGVAEEDVGRMTKSQAAARLAAH